MPKSKKKLIVIVGPTASGKSELALKLAKKINGEIIAADSRQVYKGLDIGTAKIKGEWCTDIASPKKTFTVVEYKKCAENAIAAIYRKGKIPILVGGTGFYIRALVDGLVLPQVPPNLKLRKKLEKLPPERLFKILQKKDARRAKTIEPKNKRRLIRALEIIAALGKVPKLKKHQKYDALFLGIKRTPAELKKRIEKRISRMLKQGLVKEVQKLRASRLPWKRIYEFGFEYKYPALYLQKKISRNEMQKMLLKETLDYARRQLVWFKKDKRIKWI
ncbi:MAG: tRNA (adenosine(37)-N6)-dimethylallyltransferase MiaA [Patescibacteria group bacterium]